MSHQLSPSQRGFLDLLMRREALCFGDFTLKSGRKSPYFVNTGRLCTGGDLATLGDCYAGLIQDRLGEKLDAVFGPAYKGIPLALATATALEVRLGRPIGWVFDRKEAKTHGDGGQFVGIPLNKGDRVVVVDDVITDGGAKRETLSKLTPLGLDIRAFVVGVDREEKGPGGQAAAAELAAAFGIPVLALVTISQAVEHLTSEGRLEAGLAGRVRAHLAAARSA